MTDKTAFLRDVRKFDMIASLKELWELFGCDNNPRDLPSWVASSPDLIVFRGEGREIYVASKKLTLRIFFGITKQLVRANNLLQNKGQQLGDKCFEGKKIYKLNKRQFANIIQRNMYRGKDVWQKGSCSLPLEELIRFGETFGLVKLTAYSNSYLFPLVFILQKKDRNFCNSFLAEFLNALQETLEMGIQEEAIVLHVLSKKNFFMGMDLLPDRARSIISYRAGFETGKQETLEAIGKKYGLTRERIRQVENKFLKKIRCLNGNGAHYFIKGFIFSLLARRGNLVFRRENLILNFLLDCFDIEKSLPRGREIAIIGFPKSDLEDLVGISKNNEFLLLEKEEILKKIDDFFGGILGKRDLFNIYKYIKLRCSLSKFQKVFLALKEIGHVAHFSEITERYNQMFPDDISLEHAVHAVLTRGDPAIVWVGCKGMYALSEWGFHRPDETIFETVAGIVEKVHLETGEWVTFASVEAEIGKIRPLLNKNSLLIALTLNPKITSQRGKIFKPKETNEDVTECHEDNDNEDDLIAERIEEFRKSQCQDFPETYS